MTTTMHFFSVQRSAFSVQRSAFRVQRSAFSVYLSLLLSFCLLTNQSAAQSNSNSCGFVPTATQKAQYNAIMAQMNSNSAPQQVLTPVPLNATIPIYFWVNKDTPIPQSLPTALELIKVVERVNTYFHFLNNAQFSFCGVSYLNDSRWYTIPSSNPTLNPNSLLFSTYSKANAINIYLSESYGVSFAGGPDENCFGTNRRPIRKPICTSCRPYLCPRIRSCF